MFKDPREMTKRERIDWLYAVDAMRMIEFDIHDAIHRNTHVPLEWNRIAYDHDADRRDTSTVRVTIRLDRDVVRFFKALGPGYQPRMNRVLRAFMHARLSKFIGGADTTLYVTNPEAVLKDHRDKRPEWGEIEAMRVKRYEDGLEK